MASDEPPTTSTKRKAEWFELDEDHNTYVYISGLPLDLTEEEFIDLVKKYGIIAKKTVPGTPFNIKMYKDKDGNFKGDGLCCYAKVESVSLALEYLNGYIYDDKHTLRCERAKFELKGSYDPKKKPRTLDSKTKHRLKKGADNLLSWESKDKPEMKQKRVILKHMFTPDEIVEDPTLILDIKEDIESKCSTNLCEPKKILVYDNHPDGVIAVDFAEPSQAEACAQMLDGQFYAGRVIKAEVWDGKTKYRIKETDEDEARRLERFEEDIQKSGDEGD